MGVRALTLSRSADNLWQSSDTIQPIDAQYFTPTFRSWPPWWSLRFETWWQLDLSCVHFDTFLFWRNSFRPRNLGKSPGCVVHPLSRVNRACEGRCTDLAAALCSCCCLRSTCLDWTSHCFSLDFWIDLIGDFFSQNLHFLNDYYCDGGPVRCVCEVYFPCLRERSHASNC